MDIQLEKNSSTEALIKINLKVSDYQSNFKEKLKTYSKQASIKGFRPGKVPIALIEKMYGKSIMVEEINKILVDSIKDYIKTNDIKIIGDPLPNQEKAQQIDWDKQEEFEFEYRLGLIDNFDYNLNIKVDKFEIELDEKEVAENLKNLREQYGKMTIPEVSAEGDSLFGLLVQESTGFDENVLIEINKVSATMKDSLIGLEKEAEVKIDIHKLFDDQNELEEVLNISAEAISELSGEFTFTVKNINRNEAAELNQEFFDRVFGNGKVTSEEQFMEEYSKIYKENYDKQSEYLLAHDIQEKIIEETTVDVPEQFYKDWILAGNPQIGAEELEENFKHYLKDLKWTLIKNRIASDNDVKIEYEEAVAQTKKMYMAQFGGMSLSEEMDKNLEVLANNYLQQKEGQNYMNMYEQIKTEKIIDIIKQKADISVNKVTLEEFNKKGEE
ncbi:MAG: trigger factor [Cyclobacteriaceae bacterium]|nr:trigger factor [Cyclobacteriaceae bacterium]